MTEFDEETQLLIDSYNSMYQALGFLGVDPSRLRMNYQFGDTDDDIISIALPDNKVAITTNEDDPEAEEFLRQDGWKVFRVDSSDILRFHGIFSNFIDIARADKLRTMSATDKTTSSHEDRLLEEILRRGIKEPDRNFRFLKDNGKELTTPDFTWESYKIAFFVDGLWWHVSMDDKDRLETLRNADNEKDLMELNRTRQEKDSENRSILASRGWMILSCTDRDLETPEGVRAKASMIANAMANIDKQRRETFQAIGDMDFSKKKVAKKPSSSLPDPNDSRKEPEKPIVSEIPKQDNRIKEEASEKAKEQKPLSSKKPIKIDIGDLL